MIDSAFATDGRPLRLNRVFSTDGCASIVTLDSLLIYGESPGGRRMQLLCEQLDGGGVTAVMAYPEQLSRLPVGPEVARIAALSASTTAGDATNKVIVASVEDALRAGADMVALQFHLASHAENAMLGTLGTQIAQAHRFGVPVMAIAYARPNARQEPLRHGEGLDGAPAPCLHTHAALVARELGADAVKVLFEEDEDCLAVTVEACWPVPVVVAGGPLMSLDDWAERARRAIRAGARGFCVGRNVVQADEPLAVLGAVGRALREEPAWRA